MDDLLWLTQWISSHFDGEWEHEHGVTLESVDNPGWMLRIDLDGTGVNPAHFKPVALQRSDSDWIEAKIENGAFLGGAGPNNLPELLHLFRSFIDPDTTPARQTPSPQHPKSQPQHRPPHQGKPRRPNPNRGPRRG
jgi:hypothetical protein